MSGYTKLFNSILHSTIWRAKNETRLVWITMLAMADRHGRVAASIPGLADAARVTLKSCLTALSELSSPDEFSRTKDHDGRRITEIDGGWQLLNHAKYRDILSAEERREYKKIKQREYRQRLKSVDRRVDTNSTSGLGGHIAAPAPEATTEASSNSKDVLKQKQQASSNTGEVARHQGNGVYVSSPIQINGTATDDVKERAGRFCERYAELYPLHRKGARYLPKPALDWPKACDLCATWDDARLEQLAIVFLKTDHEFAAKGSRTIGQFAALASWCDDRLREVESGGR